MKKRMFFIFVIFGLSTLCITAFSYRQTGPAQAIAGKNCGVQHNENTGHDSHGQKNHSNDEKKQAPDTHAVHDGHDHADKDEKAKKCPAEGEKKHDHDQKKPPLPNHEEHKSRPKHDDHTEHHHHGHSHSAEISDLDKSVDEMWQARCEHNILHYTCDECRYELGVVKLSDSILKSDAQPGLVSVVTVERRDFSKQLQLTGEVALHESRTVRITSPVQGIIMRFFVDIGQSVEQGQLLCELDSIDAAEAKADFMKKATALTLARKAAEREAALFAKKISAEADVLEAKNRQAEAEIELANARAKLTQLGFSEKDIQYIALGTSKSLSGTLPLYAPRSGRVLERYGSIGDRIDAVKDILLVSYITELGVWADIRESDLPLVSGGSRIKCEVESQGFAGRKYSGVLEAITGVMNEQTRTVRARIMVTNNDGQLRPGTFVNVTMFLPLLNNVLAVPQVALLSDAGRDFVFVHKEGDYWIRRPVEKGEVFGTYVTITKGIDEGQKIIADGSFLLKSDVLRSKMGAGCAD